MKDNGWQRRFEQPIQVDGSELITLRDAANYITSLPVKEQSQEHWHIAIEMLLNSAEQNHPIMFAEIAMRKAITHDKPQ